MSTVTGLTIEDSGLGYTNGTFVVLNQEHGESLTGVPVLSNLYVTITTLNGQVQTAVPVDGKTGLDFNVGDYVFVQGPSTVERLCILRITSVEP